MQMRHASEFEIDDSVAELGAEWMRGACGRLRRLVSDGWCRVLVAEENCELIAVLGLALHPSEEGRPAKATICELAVHPDHNHRGVGSRLVRFAEGIARIHGCLLVEVAPGLEGWGDGQCWRGLGYEDPQTGLHKTLGSVARRSAM